VARGFTSLKLRVGAAAFPDDLRRLARLRDRFGDAIEIVVDANGRWPLAEAPERLAMLAPYRLAYVEQPVTADLDVIAGLARESPVPVMLDESVDSPAAVDAVAAAGGVLWAHLKLVKLGGIGPTADAARKLAAAGVPFMIGQMNEGAIATAAAVHVAAAVAPRFRELYGADGLVDDPASGLSYGDGRVRIADGRGLGIAFDPSGTRIIEEYDA
jgi:L-alanine-DL-glutamate epimerase-like enolase superfamily enzyme